MKTGEHPITLKTAHEAASIAQEVGYIRNLTQVAEGISTCSLATRKTKTGRSIPCFSWHDVAREMSLYLPGQCRILGSGGVSWINGGNGPHGMILNTSQWQDWEESREVCRSILGATHPLKTATVGQIARLLLAKAVDEQPYTPDAEDFLQGAGYGYHDCIPGKYRGYTLYDAKGYYWHILSSLPSLRVQPAKRSLSWEKMHNDEVEGWADIKSAIKDCKLLRNAMVGVMAGSLKRGTAYTRSGCREGEGCRRISVPGAAGPFAQPLCLWCEQAGSYAERNPRTLVASIVQLIRCASQRSGSRAYGLCMVSRSDKKQPDVPIFVVGVAFVSGTG